MSLENKMEQVRDLMEHQINDEHSIILTVMDVSIHANKLLDIVGNKNSMEDTLDNMDDFREAVGMCALSLLLISKHHGVDLEDCIHEAINTEYKETFA